MSLFGACRMVSGSRVSWRAGRRKAKHDQLGVQGKSPCPDRRKPLSWLAFSRAWRSVASMSPVFCERFQRFDMHGAIFAPIGAPA